jgi:hypothetical protein
VVRQKGSIRRSRVSRDIKLRTLVFCTFVVAQSKPMRSQVIVENPSQLQFRQDQVEMTYEFARKQVAEELFPAQRFPVPEFQVTLKLGCEDTSGIEYAETRIVGAKPSSADSAVICMKTWNLERFSYGLIKIIEGRLISYPKRAAIVEDVVRRVKSSTPVTVAELKSKR